MVTSQERGHPVYFNSQQNAWQYLDDKSPANVERPCVKCHLMATPEGYDPCLGHIQGATAACCGHGVEEGFVILAGVGRRPMEPFGRID